MARSVLVSLEVIPTAHGVASPCRTFPDVPVHKTDRTIEYQENTRNAKRLIICRDNFFIRGRDLSETAGLTHQLDGRDNGAANRGGGAA
jgi:hypothetical protein